MKKRLLAGIMAIALVGAMIAGCGVSGGEAAPASSAAEGEAAAPAAAAKASKDPFNGDKVKIAYVPNTGSSANAQAWERGIRDIYEPLNEIYGGFEIQTFDPNGDNDEQIKILNNLVTQGYDGLIIQSVDQSGIIPAVEECKEAGMTIVSLNMRPNTGHMACVSLGGYKNGYMEGKVAAEMLGGKGKVVVIDVPAEVTQAVGDCPWVGFLEALAEYPDIEILEKQPGNFTAENGNEIMRDFLTKYPEIDLAWCSNDAMAEGAALAIESAGRQGIAVWGSDGESQALEYIEQGKMTGTLYSNPMEMGKTAAYYVLLGIMSKIDLNTLSGNPDYPLSIMVPNVAVTAENVADITERW